MRTMDRQEEARARGGYDPGEGHDEAYAGPGEVRAPYAAVLDRLAGADLDGLVRRVNDRLAAEGVLFGGADEHPFRVDPVPRVITAEERRQVAAGARQRVRALDAFVADAYGERRAVREGVVPARVLDGTPYFERDLVGSPPPTAGWVGLAGLDLVRDGDGRFRVLEDNLRTPSGLAYAQAASDAVAEEAGLPEIGCDHLGQAGAALRRALEASAPEVEGDLVLVSDGEANSAWYEHRRLAEVAGLRLVTPADLRAVDGHVELEDGTRVRALYRRTDDDRVRDEAGSLTPLAGVVLDAVRAGGVGMVNRFGTGVADDKMLYAHVDDLVRFFLDEEPELPSVATYDLADPERRASALDRLGELVAKPRDGHGGEGVVVGPTASAAEVDRVRDAIRRDPEAWVVQDVVQLSTCPVVVDGALEPRHVDLRVFAVHDGEDVVTVPGGLSRVALEPGSMVVNSSRQGGAKATWVQDADGRSPW